MALNLIKPLGSDIYNIAVFNQNSQTIEEYLANLPIHDYDSFPFYNTTGDLSINNVLTNTGKNPSGGIYYISGKFINGPDSLTQQGQILIVQKPEITTDGSKTNLYLLTSEGAYKAQYDYQASALTEWTSLVEVIDNLSSEDSDNALSAKMGKQLNDTKSGLIFMSNTEENISVTLDIDSLYQERTAIYFCSHLQLEGTYPQALQYKTNTSVWSDIVANSFTLKNYTNNRIPISGASADEQDIICRQELIDNALDLTYVRTGSYLYNSVTSNYDFTWSNWVSANAGSASFVMVDA